MLATEIFRSRTNATIIIIVIIHNSHHCYYYYYSFDACFFSWLTAAGPCTSPLRLFLSWDLRQELTYTGYAKSSLTQATPRAHLHRLHQELTNTGYAKSSLTQATPKAHLRRLRQELTYTGHHDRGWRNQDLRDCKSSNLPSL